MPTIDLSECAACCQNSSSSDDCCCPQDGSYTFTLAGITDFQCQECDFFNDSFLLEHAGGCEWRWDGPVVCNRPVTITLTIAGVPEDPSLCDVILTIGAQTVYRRTFNRDEIDCDSLELDLFDLTTFCDGWPLTVTVTKV